jgi:hypothetical protein
VWTKPERKSSRSADSYKVTKGIITKVAESTRTVVVTIADGTEKTFTYTEDAGKDMAKAVAKGTEKGAKVAVDYAAKPREKVARFFGL